MRTRRRTRQGIEDERQQYVIPPCASEQREKPATSRSAERPENRHRKVTTRGEAWHEQEIERCLLDAEACTYHTVYVQSGMEAVAGLRVESGRRSEDTQRVDRDPETREFDSDEEQ